MKRKIGIAGSTGSIGTQALEVIDAHPDLFEVSLLTAGKNAGLLMEQAIKFKPDAVVIGDTDKYQEVKKALLPHNIKVYAGAEALEQIMAYTPAEIILTAMVGFAGLAPTLKAIENKKHIALANKETMVVAGKLVTALARQHEVNILPVDSEHSAIFQCLAGEWHNPPEKIILTASGGPFRGKSIEQLSQVTREQALKHPNWTMGAKITIDSASLMNKGLEVIEARWLFGIPANQIEVIVHPQSIVHSLVQFSDGSIKAQLGLPDMKLPIIYALSYPYRAKTVFERFDFTRFPDFSFEPPDLKTFRNLQLAFDALEKDGNMPCVLNAANEVAVDAFLHGKCRFLEMSDVVEHCLQHVPFMAEPAYQDLIQTDALSRETALNYLKIKHD